MDKFLITGFSGFVSMHFLNYLEANTIKSSVLGIDLSEPEFEYNNYQNVKCRFKAMDLLASEKLDQAVCRFQPDYVLHLASYSSVAFSWKNPVESFKNNTNIFLNLLEAVKKSAHKCRILSVGSSEEYGNVTPEMVPLKENTILNPVSPYAVARVAQENLSIVYEKGFNMDIVMTRSFNHIGPGQKDIFVVSSFAKQIAKFSKAGMTSGTLSTGDTTIIRDFLDVRDVVNAYYLLIKNGKKGEIYNICSGKGISLKEIIDNMADILKIQISTSVDPSRLRPSDNKIIIGCNDKIKEFVGWTTKIPFKKSLKDILDFWYKVI